METVICIVFLIFILVLNHYRAINQIKINSLMKSKTLEEWREDIRDYLKNKDKYNG